MGTFKQYMVKRILAEKAGAEVNAEVIYQKMVDALDNAHIDFSEEKIQFNIGKVIKNSNIDIDMTIRAASSDDVALGHRKDGTKSIVVSTEGDLPARDEIDSFLSDTATRGKKVKALISTYLKDFYSKEDRSMLRTKYEEDSEANSSIEDLYEKLVEQLRQRIEDFNGTVEELKNDMDTENVGKRETAKRAMKQIAKEQFGDTSEEFKKIALGLLGSAKSMTKENKDKLSNRLDSFYDQKIKPLLAR